MSPLVITSIGLLSARTASYLVGFVLGSIVGAWLPIIALLVSLTGMFGLTNNTQECEQYRARMAAVDESNRAALANYRQQYQRWYDSGVAQAYYAAKTAYETTARAAARQVCFQDFCKQICGPNSASSCGYNCSACLNDANSISYPGSAPVGPTPPVLQTYPSCSSPNCPPGKKTWVQVLWASRTGNFSDPKGCFLVAYSQDSPTIPPEVQYNPFLPKPFVLSRARSYYLVKGDRFRGVNSSNWRNLESVTGWDRGYWQAESTDPECRGWRPGWSVKVR